MTRKEQGNVNKGEPQELYLLYQNATANLDALKKSQWQVLVFFSVIAAFLIAQATELSSPIKVFLSLALFAGVISAIVMLEQYWKKIDQERTVLDNIYKRFGQEFGSTPVNRGRQ